MMDPLDPRIENALDKLKNSPHREAENAVKGRAIFLGEAHKIQLSVSNSEMLRHKGWNQKKSWTTRIFRKETSPMFTTLVSAFLAIVLALGGSGVTLAAAQSSNSDDFLYPLKLFSEDVRLELINGTPEAIRLELEYLIRRTMELQEIIGENKIPSTGLINRLQEQINTILQQATRLDKEDSLQLMQQVRDQIQIQEQLFQQLQSEVDDPTMLQIRTMLQDRIRLLDLATGNSQMTQEQLQQKLQEQMQLENQLQEQIKEQEQLRNQTQQPIDAGNSLNDQNQTGEPGYQNGDGSPVETPVPGNGNGQEATPLWPTDQPNRGGGNGQNQP
jgi:hypothetical protein